MNSNEEEIERLLRNAPQPVPPVGLKDRLIGCVSPPRGGAPPMAKSSSVVSGSWWRRWWPALAPATAALAGAAVVMFQQMETHDLQQSIQTLSKSLPLTEAVSEVKPRADEVRTDAPADLAGKEPAEIERLKQLASQLAAEVRALEQVQKANEELRSKLNAPPTLTQEELEALENATAKSLSLRCLNNLKQFGLAVRVWVSDNEEVFPPDSLSMSNELGTPIILACPADTNRVVAKSWQTFSSANCSYEYLTPSATNAEHEPTRVLSRCPIHGHVGLSDGSVQREVAKTHPEWLKQRDGKLYLEP